MLVAAELAELREAEKASGLSADPLIDALLKAEALEGREENIVTEYMLKILGLDVRTSSTHSPSHTSLLTLSMAVLCFVGAKCWAFVSCFCVGKSHGFLKPSEGVFWTQGCAVVEGRKSEELTHMRKADGELNALRCARTRWWETPWFAVSVVARRSV